MSSHTKQYQRRLVISVIGGLCLILIVMIVYFFYSLLEIRHLAPQPYVTIINNNLAAKNKLLLLKSEVYEFSNEPTLSSLFKLKTKSRVYQSSILQDLQSKRTILIHEQYGNIDTLNRVIYQFEPLSVVLNQITVEDKQSVKRAVQEIDALYLIMNEYLSGFVSEVQKNQMQFNQYKEGLYNKQFVYLGTILICSLFMIGIISWMYLYQSKLSRDLQERTNNLEEAKKLAEQSATAKARFLANMSHEMRTPLNAIIGLSQKEYYQACDDQTRRFVVMINRSGQHLLKLINSVLDISKIENGKVTIEQEEFYISDLIEASKTIFVEQDKTQVEIYFSCHLSRNFKLIADKTKLIQIINNLSFNAVKFTHQGYVDVLFRLEIDTGATNLVISITDTGIGMTKEQLATVFEEFTQADESITRRFGGTGLGLSICQSLVQLMGGTIHVESELDKGSCFTVTVPIEVKGSTDIVPFSLQGKTVSVVSEDAFAQRLITNELKDVGLYDEFGEINVVYLTEADTNIEQFSSHSTLLVVDNQAEGYDAISTVCKPYDVFSLLKALDELQGRELTAVVHQPVSLPTSLSCLIVEDTKVNQIVAEKMLSTLNVRTRTVNNGRECLDILKSESFDLIFMDIHMPVMDGVEALKRIRTHCLAPNTAVVALTANAFESDVEYYLQQGFDDVLPKPYQLEWMRGMLEKHCFQSDDHQDSA